MTRAADCVQLRPTGLPHMRKLRPLRLPQHSLQPTSGLGAVLEDSAFASQTLVHMSITGAGPRFYIPNRLLGDTCAARRQEPQLE